MNALETFLASADQTPIVWVLNIDYTGGMRTTVHASPKSADAELLLYVTANWEAAREYDETLPKIPADCEDPVDRYFETVGWETESYQIDGLTINP